MLRFWIVTLTLCLAAAFAHVPPTELTQHIVSQGPDGSLSLNLVGRGRRAIRQGTTDVWVQDGYAYLGTFDRPCGDGNIGDAGVQIFDVRNPLLTRRVGALPSVKGSRVNDVKVAPMNTGTLLVHSNEACRANGPGGFELYNVDNPLEPIHLAHVQTDSINLHLRDQEGQRDEGVHNLFLFRRDGRDYVAAQVSTSVGDFQIFDVTDPNRVKLVSHFSSLELKWPGVDWVTETDSALLDEAQAYIFSGYGELANRLLHDHYVTPDGQTAYLANWDAGLIRLDISHLAKPSVVSVALELDSEDGEVNSHSVWPNAQGTVVVEGEEDFSPISTQLQVPTGRAAGVYPSQEGSVSRPIAQLPEGRFEGELVYLGEACGALPAAREAQVALVLRGTCTFLVKGLNAADAGYQGLIVFNTPEGGNELVSMGGDGYAELPGLFVGHDSGLKLLAADKLEDLSLGQRGETVIASTEASGWSGVRIWDYSRPEVPVLASTFNTLCSAFPLDESCDPDATYSSHNVIVEGDRAYISWYAEGVVVIDISDPYAPFEIARYQLSEDELARNNGPQDVWGIYKVPGEPLIYASDRNGGLYVLREETRRGLATSSLSRPDF